MTTTVAIISVAMIIMMIMTGTYDDHHDKMVNGYHDDDNGHISPQLGDLRTQTTDGLPQAEKVS